MVSRECLQRATKIANVHSWGTSLQSGLKYRNADCYWLSDTVMLTCNGEYPLEHSFAYDVRSHSTTPLTGLDEIFKQNRKARADAGLEISPDGQWLLWANTSGNTVWAARLNGSDFHVARSLPPGDTLVSTAWKSDSRHFVMQTRNARRINTLNTTGGDVNFPGKLRSLSSSEGALSVSPGEPFVETEWDDVIITMDTRTALAPFKTRTVKLYTPSYVQIVEVWRSNKGDRLAWLLRSDQSGFARWLHRVFPYYKDIAPPQSDSIWFSRIDGTGMHEAGRLLKNPNDPNEAIDNFRWLPSDKTVSFFYKEDLWTLPAD